MQQILMLVLFGGAFLGYFIWMKKKTSSMMAQVPDSFRMLFERTGYRLTELGPTAPLEQHVAQAVARTTALQQGAQAHQENYTRDFHGVAIQYQSYMGAGADANTRVISARWSARNPARPRVLLEVAEKSLVGVRKALGEAFSNMTRNWEPSLPQFQSGDPELDARFFFYASDANAGVAIVRDASVKAHLLGSAEVCLCAHADEVFFSDPMQKNVNAGIGGTVGQMAVGLDIMKRTELMIPVHDRMAELIATVQRLCR
jgi:hypothetical protein